MAAILDKTVKADVILLATPVYFYTMNAQMKTLIDRTVPRYSEIANINFCWNCDGSASASMRLNI